MTAERMGGREAWWEFVKAQSRLPALETRQQEAFEPMRITPKQLQAIQERERRFASPAEIARAEALGDRAEECPHCGGAGVVGMRMNPGELAIHAPCECQPLEARAAYAGIPSRYRAATLG